MDINTYVDYIYSHNLNIFKLSKLTYNEIHNSKINNEMKIFLYGFYNHIEFKYCNLNILFIFNLFYLYILFGKINAIKIILLYNKLTFDIDFKYSIQIAAHYGHFNLIKLFEKQLYYISLNNIYIDCSKTNIYLYSISRYNKHIIKILDYFESKGVNIHKRNIFRDNAYSRILDCNFKYKYLKKILIYLESKNIIHENAYIILANISGKTSIPRQIKSYIKIFDFLESRGINIYKKDSYGNNASNIYLGPLFKSLKLLRYFISKGINIYKQKNYIKQTRMLEPIKTRLLNYYLNLECSSIFKHKYIFI